MQMQAKTPKTVNIKLKQKNKELNKIIGVSGFNNCNGKMRSITLVSSSKNVLVTTWIHKIDIKMSENLKKYQKLLKIV